MPDEKRTDESALERDRGKIGGPSGAVGPGKLPPGQDPSASSEAEASKKLTPDEQMALFEKDLKENDWGHQPC
jgi:hypothetical protein